MLTKSLTLRLRIMAQNLFKLTMKGNLSLLNIFHKVDRVRDYQLIIQKIRNKHLQEIAMYMIQMNPKNHKRNNKNQNHRRKMQSYHG